MNASSTPNKWKQTNTNIDKEQLKLHNGKGLAEKYKVVQWKRKSGLNAEQHISKY